MDQSFYDESYFERGIETDKSNFTNYRWLPEATMSMAMIMIDLLPITPNQKILDYGSAKGYLVKAFRLLHRQAWGVDISKYAIENCDPDVKEYCGNSFPQHNYDWCIVKDVLEHISEDKIIEIVNTIPTKRMFIVVPLGENGKYYAPANDLDKSHVTCQPLNWWGQLFFNNGWNVLKHTYRIDGIKDGYYEKYPQAHGFFILEKKC